MAVARGRAAGRRSLLSPSSRVAPSSQGLASPPRGLREALGSPASPVLGHLDAAGLQDGPGGSGSGPGAAKPARLGCSRRRSWARSTGLGRPSRLLLHPLAPPRRRRRRLCCSGRRRGPRHRLPPSARAERSCLGAGAAAARAPAGLQPPGRPRQLCSSSARGGAGEEGPRVAQVRTPGGGRVSEGRVERRAQPPWRVCLGSSDSPPLPPPLPPPAPSPAARAAPQGGSGLRGLLLCAATMVSSE